MCCASSRLRLKVAGLGEQTGYQLPMTQEQLGDATGLTSVHVNRTLKLLEADGLIERISPRSIIIGDWKKLADVGDFDSNYLHLHERRAGAGLRQRAVRHCPRRAAVAS